MSRTNNKQRLSPIIIANLIALILLAIFFLRIANKYSEQESEGSIPTPTVTANAGISAEIPKQKSSTNSIVEVEKESNITATEPLKHQIEVDLASQKVRVYVYGNLELETDCVTGNVRNGNATPTGTFVLTYKETDSILRGPLLASGQREYETPVDYWMPFNGDIGFHDAWWRSDFGKDIYLNNGSHGCVNLPTESAQKLFELIDFNMPIIVY